jgi:hypothetical protein
MIVISLSSHEEDTLRLVAHGACPASLLRADDIDQLTRLGLVGQQDGQVWLSDFGALRLAQIKELALQASIRAARARQPHWERAA